MSAHELALQKALIAHLKLDTAVTALLGDRIWDAVPNAPAYPHLLTGRSQSRSVAADGGGIEHALTLTVVSRFRGTEEAKAVVAAVRLSLAEAALAADGVRAVSARVTSADIYPAPDGHRIFAAMRVRAVTESI